MSKIKDADSFGMGKRRCWWFDKDDGWKVGVAIVAGLGELRIQCGPAAANGGWCCLDFSGRGVDAPQCEYVFSGQDIGSLYDCMMFARSHIGDGERLEEAFMHLCRCQYDSDDIERLIKHIDKQETTK